MRNRITSQTLKDKSQKRTKLENTSKCQLYNKDRLAKLLSYHPMTDIRLPMKKGKVVDGFHHSIFHSLASHVMGWPFFLAFVPIDNDNEEEKEV
jgi:hypothetical protein